MEEFLDYVTNSAVEDQSNEWKTTEKAVLYMSQKDDYNLL